MTLEQLKANLESLKQQALRVDGGIQTLLLLIQQVEASAAEVKD